MHDKTSETLNELLQLARDGRDFYSWAALQDTSPELRDVFRALTSAKAELINDLSVHVATLGDPPALEGTLKGGLRKAYTEVRTKFTSDLDPMLIAQLEGAEDEPAPAARHGEELRHPAGRRHLDVRHDRLAVERLHVDRPMRAKVYRIHKHLSPGGMHAPRNLGNIQNGPDRV